MFNLNNNIKATIYNEFAKIESHLLINRSIAEPGRHSGLPEHSSSSISPAT